MVRVGRLELPASCSQIGTGRFFELFSLFFKQFRPALFALQHSRLVPFPRTPCGSVADTVVKIVPSETLFLELFSMEYKNMYQTLHSSIQRDEELFFLPSLVLFSGFLSILFPFKTSLAPCFPSVPVPSVAIYVVKSRASLELIQRGSNTVCNLIRTLVTLLYQSFLVKAAQGVGRHNQRLGALKIFCATSLTAQAPVEASRGQHPEHGYS